MPPTSIQAVGFLLLVAALVADKEDCRQLAAALLPHLSTHREMIY
ncbi:hypothetical protein [Paeniglutamicibacter gangotriensis]|nr:hypothetical protein [Paeniglutamicibacter gangotriensis]